MIALIGAGTVAAAVVAVSVGFLPRALLHGRVIDLDGRPVNGARVAMADAVAKSAEDGTFSLAASSRAGWVRADAQGFLPRLRPARAEHDVLLRLTPDDGQTISLVFGGDVMFGRRFYDPNEDGDLRDGLLQPTSGAPAHAALLDDVEPALSAADVAIVNLESPLLADPVAEPASPRPSSFHPTKEFVFASSPAAAKGLRMVGIDVVGLGNNHLFDGLENGVRETTAALDAAGFAARSGRAGAGATASEAWEAAVQPVHGTSVAVVACTTIDGRDQAISYVADATKGGAADCSEQGIATAVRAAKSRAQLVVMMIHGGYEYDRSPSPQIRSLSAAARTAGAALVVNHHPHVIGGFERDGNDLTAWTIGNLLFDQTVWPTFESYLLTVHVRAGQVIRAMADPLVIDGFRPLGLVGDLAEHVARDAAGWEPGSFVVEDGSVEISTPDRVAERSLDVHLDGPNDGAVMRLPGATAIDPRSVGDVDVGRDLLWTGDFEVRSTSSGAGDPLLWKGPSRGGSVEAEAARSGRLGYRLRRTGASTGDIIVAPAHRIPIDAGAQLTLLASVRAAGDAESALQLNWYNDLRGPSQEQTVVSLPPNSTEGWREIRIDVKAPLNALAVLPMARVGPPNSGEATLDVDDVRLVQWGPLSGASLRTDYVRVRGRVQVHLIVAALPGWPEAPASPAVRERAWLLARPSVADLPPGPLNAGPGGD
jgi:poly-gamma-glutamate synthesis protein (capsule biosynthesis protein)